jgi:hypothetical protein
MAASADRKDYWLAAADAGIFAFGDVPVEGSTVGVHLNAPIDGMAANPSGPRYWLAAADGGVFALGGAPYRGSMAGYSLSGPIVGISIPLSWPPRTRGSRQRRLESGTRHVLRIHGDGGSPMSAAPRRTSYLK